MKRFLFACLLMLGTLPALAQTSFVFSSTPGHPVGRGQTLSYSTTNATLIFDGSPEWLRIDVHGNDGKLWHLDLSPPAGTKLVPGKYYDAVDWGNVTGRSSGLDFGGDGRGCSPSGDVVVGSFTIRQIAFDATGKLSKLEATVLDNCGTTSEWLAIEMRYRASYHMFGVDSQPAHWAAKGIKRNYYNDLSTFNMETYTPASLKYSVSGLGNEWDVWLMMPAGRTRFAKGTIYTHSRQEGVYGRMSVDPHNSASCEFYESGVVNILEVIYGPNDRLDKFYADFTHYCAPDRTGPWMKGRIRWVRGN